MINKKFYYLILTVFFTQMWVVEVYAQDTFSYEPEENVERKLQFLYTNEPVRKEMFSGLNDKEKVIISRHFQYLSMLRDKGILILAGPNLDNTFGIVVFFAESEEEAKKIMENDPANKEEIMTADLHPFRVSLMYDFNRAKE